MAELRLDAQIRTERGKGPARRLRAGGHIPATMYGESGEAIALSVEARALQAALTGDAGVNALIDLHFGNESQLAMARELTRHPIKGSIIHVDFLRIDRTKTITVDVPVHLEGDAAGVSEGGVLEHHTWQLHVSCLPTDVPDSISVDVSGLRIGDSLRVADLTPPDGVTILTGEEEIVVSVVIPQLPTLEEEAAEAAEAAEGEAAEGEAAEGGDAGASEGAEGEES